MPTAPGQPVDPPTLPLDLSGVGIEAPPPSLDQQLLFGYTHQQPNGNRLVAGSASLPSRAERVDLAGEPAWVVGVPNDGGGQIWAVVLRDGQVQAFHVLEGRLAAVTLSPSSLPAGMPPLLRLDHGVPGLVTPPGNSASPFTHPILLGSNPTRLAFIEADGDLVIWEGSVVARFAIEALPDARLLQDGQGRLLVYSGATERYGHSVLGDGLEASSITIILDGHEPRLAQQFELPADQVFEGIAPIWKDLDQDGQLEIITTVSDADQGARIEIYSESGQLLSAGESTGQGFRWRHVLAVAPFDIVGNRLIVDILTPHIGGVAEFFHRQESILAKAGTLSGFSTHRFGSRNLDMAVAGDLDNDGLLEILVPSQNMQSLVALSFAPNRLNSEWTLDLGGRLMTNIGAISMPDGQIILAAGTDLNELLIWPAP